MRVHFPSPFLAPQAISYVNVTQLPDGGLRKRCILLLLVACSFAAILFAAKPASATTYYLAPASQGGNDGNNGLSATHPWLSPNHTVNCGDVILAEPSTAYSSANFNSGKWGWVNCSAGNNVAWLQCETFDGCKIWSTSEGIYVDHPYWGVQGWEVTVESGANGFCFGVAPSWNYPYAVHHVIFANNVANGCQAGGIVTFNDGKTAGDDYIAVIGNIVYAAAQGSAVCYTGISIYQPIQYDNAPGTHIYVGGNISYGNYQPYTCAGIRAWGGDGLIFDTLDGSDSHLPYPYTAQAVADNNILISNGGQGLEVQNNVAGSAHATVVLRNNTSWGNEQASYQQSNGLCSEILLNSAYNVHAYNNIAAVNSTTACAGNALYAFRAYTVDGTDWVYSNFISGYNQQNTSAYATTNNGTFSFGSSNTTGQTPGFADAVTPPAPYCSGTSNTTNCMSAVISHFTPSNGTAKSAGYHWPSSTSSYDPLFPQWVCNVNLPSGLITKGC